MQKQEVESHEVSEQISFTDDDDSNPEMMVRKHHIKIIKRIKDTPHVTYRDPYRFINQLITCQKGARIYKRIKER